MKVYLLSYYSEGGADCVRATINKDHLPHMLKAFCGDYYEESFLTRMQELLNSGELLDGENLAAGWGGPMLHIVELE